MTLFIYAAVKCLLLCGRNAYRLLNLATLLPTEEEVFLKAVPLILKAWKDLAMKQTETFTWYSHSDDPRFDAHFV
jgi:hypothetical protein